MRKQQINLAAALMLFGAGLFALSCQEPGEALTDRKKRENDQEIRDYLTQNNLRQDTIFNDIYRVRTLARPGAQLANIGDEVQFHYVSRRLDGVIIDSTNQAANIPFKTVLTGQITQADRQAGFTNGLLLGVRFLVREGERATLLVPSSVDQRIGSLLLPQFAPIRYDLHVVSVRTEDEQIEEYIRAKKLTVTQKTNEGVRIIVTQARPDSALITTGQTVAVKYTGRLLDDRTFDRNTTTGMEVRVGENRVIRGWEQAFLRLRRGEKALVIIPSSQGYGGQAQAPRSGQVAIPPYSPLVFEMEIASVK